MFAPPQNGTVIEKASWTPTVQGRHVTSIYNQVSLKSPSGQTQQPVRVGSFEPRRSPNHPPMANQGAPVTIALVDIPMCLARLKLLPPGISLIPHFAAGCLPRIAYRVAVQPRTLPDLSGTYIRIHWLCHPTGQGRRPETVLKDPAIALGIVSWPICSHMAASRGRGPFFVIPGERKTSDLVDSLGAR